MMTLRRPTYLLFFLCFFVFSDLQAQYHSDIKPSGSGSILGSKGLSSLRYRADFEFEHLRYQRALELYQTAYEVQLEKNKGEEGEQTDFIKLRIAECYRKLNQPKKAAKWYGEVIENENIIEPKHKLYYAQALSSAERYEASRKWFEAFRKEQGQHRQSQLKIQGIDSLKMLEQDLGIFEVIKLDSINSEESDFSPHFYKEGLVFSSARVRKGIFQNHVFSWNHELYLDLYYAEQNPETGQPSPPKYFHREVNTKYHEGPVTFYNDEQRMFFTRNNYQNKKARKSSDDIVKLKIFYAELTDSTSGDSWGNIKSLHFNSDEYSVGHPTLSFDEKRLYFASDMRRYQGDSVGFGGTDIYVSIWDGKRWGHPVNLGPRVNTEGDEMFPFITHDDVLYFASNGHGGLGGLDVYRAVLGDSGIVAQEVLHLGTPVNTPADDFGFIVDMDGNGYFSSNRAGGMGDDDIYGVKLSLPDYITVCGTVYDEQGNPIPNADVTLYSDAGEEIAKKDADSSGDYCFEIEREKKFTITGIKKEYTPDTTSFTSIKKIKNITGVDLLLTVPDILARGMIRNKTRNEPVSEVVVKLIDKSSGETVFEQTTTDEGTYRFEDLTPERDFELRMEKSGYFTNIVAVSTIGMRRGEIVNNYEIEELYVGKEFELENIYYDFDKANIRADAALELDKLYKVMKDNPGIKVELGSHTDARGSDSYNMSLSQRRATSAVNYLIEKGISEDRITAKGYGETQLTNQCGNGVRCTSEQHQANRRTMIKILAVEQK